jgi:hypothetical protein
MYYSDHLLPWTYAYPAALLETALNAATGADDDDERSRVRALESSPVRSHAGALIGVTVAERMFLRRNVSPTVRRGAAWRPPAADGPASLAQGALTVPVAARFAFFFLRMLPLRYRTYAKEEVSARGARSHRKP